MRQPSAPTLYKPASVRPHRTPRPIRTDFGSSVGVEALFGTSASGSGVCEGRRWACHSATCSARWLFWGFFDEIVPRTRALGDPDADAAVVAPPSLAIAAAGRESAVIAHCSLTNPDSPRTLRRVHGVDCRLQPMGRGQRHCGRVSPIGPRTGQPRRVLGLVGRRSLFLCPTALFLLPCIASRLPFLRAGHCCCGAGCRL